MNRKYYVVEYPVIDSGCLIVCAYFEEIEEARIWMKNLSRKEPFKTYAIVEVKEISENEKNDIKDKLKKINEKILNLEKQRNALLKKMENL